MEVSWNWGMRKSSLHPASRGVAAHTAGLFWSVIGAKGGVDHEDQISKEWFTYITVGFLNICAYYSTTFCIVSCIFFHKIPQIPCFLNVFACFCNGFLRSTVIYAFVGIKPSQKIMFYNASNSLIYPNPSKYRYLQCFLQFFHVPMPLANSNICMYIYIYIYIHQKSFQNIVFDSVFTMFPR